MDEFWVFGYGSLMWNPGFDYEMRVGALARGYRRSLCVRSFVHRGTPERPGLVLGLDRGGSCRGVAFRVADGKREAVLDYLRARELVTHVYLERQLSVLLEDGRPVRAVGYVVDRSHSQYGGALTVEEAARIVQVSHGQSGPNDAYVANTVAHLKEMGIRDHWLEGVAARVADLQARTVAVA
ncbi:cation transport protein ChaC [Rhizobium sp. RU35A]|uniref:glutathione-specific gamma-glutamylcyclotransferase n=2 Tax=Rhizobium straminoryzae TaxID=1387186 RepID=A0A549SZT9_9HYPH|nr:MULTISPECIES: gamma-glutamylcyclotransferase [Rhizobium]TRL35137.1 gamma-glutamylcyclotransferase [Rhizobium straminoryzae]SIQ65154.1 cation transport protein ChaC [Rhizobium sp. RU35A]